MAYYSVPSQEKASALTDRRSKSVPTQPALADPPQTRSAYPYIQSGHQDQPAALVWQLSNLEPFRQGSTLTAATASTAEGFYHDSNNTAQPFSAPFPWPSELTASLHLPYEAEGVPEQSWFPAFDTWSTVSPAATVWQSATATPWTYRPSPSLSSYSASPHPSAMSSPAYSEGYARNVGSPMIKLEEPPESATPFPNGLPATISPGHLYSMASRESAMRPPTLPWRPIATPFVPSSSTDFKPALSQRRPANRKAFSCNDVRAIARESRHRREYTKPEEAVCSCQTCGKVFQRHYNLKAHMETHDPARAQPHICLYPDCDKRFVRQTDLLRHEQSTRRRRLPQTPGGQEAHVQGSRGVVYTLIAETIVRAEMSWSNSCIGGGRGRTMADCGLRYYRYAKEKECVLHQAWSFWLSRRLATLRS
ncbi:hypothetical protein LTR02_002011 [Friedmanniomyces endolithicus]|nr:hypothetical protein LTR94_004873 [Friedmanniomyces endolithicus]KAK0796711.1 hypothetical protein LTR38_008393 [Friedmanniomyces endolithicus]KAK0811465.1 hypothetical protein LTR59_001920 [Friedmanniomyces endolithicus]KAK0812736.1 hypothetical protein LTR75_004870 [Friedmanniomyces endolithicus]KAK0840801.1 hypothetical protein LTR03_010364 [Friedmanniomyces endolithicus]